MFPTALNLVYKNCDLIEHIWVDDYAYELRGMLDQFLDQMGLTLVTYGAYHGPKKMYKNYGKNKAYRVFVYTNGVWSLEGIRTLDPALVIFFKLEATEEQVKDFMYSNENVFWCITLKTLAK